MHIIPYAEKTEIVFIGLEHGEELFFSIEKACRDSDIRHGVILSGIAVVSDADLHFVEHTGYPQDITYYNIVKPFEMNSITGIIVDFIPHIHIGLVAGKDQIHGGHLNVGKISMERLVKNSLPLYLSIIFILLLVTFFPKIVLFIPDLLMG